MHKLISVSFLLFAANAHASFNECIPTLGNVPIVATSARNEICYNGYAIRYNEKYHGPDFSVMVWNPSSDNKIQRKTWHQDNNISNPADYTLSPDTAIFDKGHLTPADLAIDDKTMYDLFYLTNQAPQYGICNKGNWKKIEQDVKKYIMRLGTPATITTGVIYEGPYAPMNAPSIPTYYWKLVISSEKTFAFVLPNDPIKCKMGVAPIHQDQLLQLLGKNYFKNPMK